MTRYIERKAGERTIGPSATKNFHCSRIAGSLTEYSYDMQENPV